MEYLVLLMHLYAFSSIIDASSYVSMYGTLNGRSVRFQIHSD